MKLLLDTSAFLWWISDHASLSQRARDLISDGNHEVWFSAVSSWEIVIKTGLGRLQLPENAERFLPNKLALTGFKCFQSICGIPCKSRVFHVCTVIPFIDC